MASRSAFSGIGIPQEKIPLLEAERTGCGAPVHLLLGLSGIADNLLASGHPQLSGEGGDAILQAGMANT
jgi:hypothetical protein